MKYTSVAEVCTELSTLVVRNILLTVRHASSGAPSVTETVKRKSCLESL